ncbi:copper resistance protein B (plasmid) [Pseudohalocynthiibacter aestuariivivens]|jgi:hypothetical protein|nr:copper resistance protein B [Pseudohalocynthiibacter aestuariivivens]QIE47730.1 copper resistance protein B [Pseudohalocynthiibacter aestuariivivens]
MKTIYLPALGVAVASMISTAATAEAIIWGFGDTSDMLRAAGKDEDEFSIVAGMRISF